MELWFKISRTHSRLASKRVGKRTIRKVFYGKSIQFLKDGHWGEKGYIKQVSKPVRSPIPEFMLEMLLVTSQIENQEEGTENLQNKEKDGRNHLLFL